MGDLGHTPGIFYAAAYFLSILVQLFVNRRRFEDWRSWGIATAFFAAIGTFMVLTDGGPDWAFIPFMAVIVLLQYACLRLACDFGKKKAAYFTVRTFILGEAAASLEWQLYYFAVKGLGMPKAVWFAVLSAVVSHGLFFWLIYTLEKRYAQANGDLEINGRELATVLVIGVSIFVLSNLSFASPETPFSARNDPEIFAIRTLVDMAGVGILFAYHMQLCELKTSIENEYLTKLLHMQYENYRVSKESVELVNRKYHDLKYQINLLRSGISREEQEAYLDQLYEEIKSYEAQNKTGNNVLDTLLTAKTLQCQAGGIILTAVADGAAMEFMDPMDVSILFGNALDNAIESVMKIEEQDKRLIHLSVDRQKNFLRIRLENTCAETPTMINGLPATSKKDKAFHGYGVKSIVSIVEKYGGSVKMLPREGWFELNLLIPVV